MRAAPKPGDAVAIGRDRVSGPFGATGNQCGMTRCASPFARSAPKTNKVRATLLGTGDEYLVEDTANDAY